MSEQVNSNAEAAGNRQAAPEERTTRGPRPPQSGGRRDGGGGGGNRRPGGRNDDDRNDRYDRYDRNDRSDRHEEPVDEDGRRVPKQYEPGAGGRPRRIGSDIKPTDIDYKNVATLSRFLDPRGRILSRRKTRVSAKVQRQIVTAIKRARHLALLPYTGDQTRIVRKRR